MSFCNLFGVRKSLLLPSTSWVIELGGRVDMSDTIDDVNLQAQLVASCMNCVSTVMYGVSPSRL